MLLKCRCTKSSTNKFKIVIIRAVVVNVDDHVTKSEMHRRDGVNLSSLLREFICNWYKAVSSGVTSSYSRGNWLVLLTQVKCPLSMSTHHSILFCRCVILPVDNSWLSRYFCETEWCPLFIPQTSDIEVILQIHLSVSAQQHIRSED